MQTKSLYILENNIKLAFIRDMTYCLKLSFVDLLIFCFGFRLLEAHNELQHVYDRLLFSIHMLFLSVYNTEITNHL